MVKTSYTACATRPEEIVVCTALNTGNYAQEYAERVSKILADIKDDSLREKVRQTLGEFQDRDGLLAQSSPYRLVGLQGILPKGKVLVARPRLQTAKENNPGFMAGFYVDCGLNLVPSEKEYKVNPVQAKALAGDLRKVGVSLDNAKLIPYNILIPQVNENSSSGLVFRLSEEGRDTAKNLVLNTSDFKWNFTPSNSGLFRAFLYWGGDWGAGGGNLAYSDEGGRVVVETTGEAGSREFESLKAQATSLIEEQRQERESLAKKLIA